MKNLKIITGLLILTMLFTGCYDSKSNKKDDDHRAGPCDVTFNYLGEDRGTLLEHLDDGVKEMFENNDMPSFVRYTVNDYDHVVTYIVSDPAIINELMNAMREVTVREFDLELGILSWDTLSFGGLYPDSNGDTVTYSIRTQDSVLDGADGWYSINYSEHYEYVLNKIISEGIVVSYTDETYQCFNSISGSWGDRSDNMEVGIFESDEGYLGMNIWTDGNELFDGNTSILISYITYTDMGYQITGLIGDEEVTFSVRRSRDSLIFEGIELMANAIE